MASMHENCLEISVKLLITRWKNYVRYNNYKFSNNGKTSLITRARNKVMCYSDMAKGLLRWGYKMSSKMGRGLVPA